MPRNRSKFPIIGRGFALTQNRRSGEIELEFTESVESIVAVSVDTRVGRYRLSLSRDTATELAEALTLASLILARKHPRPKTKTKTC